MHSLESAPVYPVLGEDVKAQVFGASAFADSPQHGQFHFPLCAGLNVLYGLNGAGKSRTLSAFASLLGVGVGDFGEGLYAQVFVDPDASLNEALGNPDVATLVDEIAGLLLKRFTHAVEPWERHKYEDYIDIDPPNEDVGSTSTLGGLAAAIAAELRLPQPVTLSLRKGGRFLYRPRSGGGADLYLGLNAGDPGLVVLAEDARDVWESVVALPAEAVSSAETQCYFGWFVDEQRPDWLQRIQRLWAGLVQQRREQAKTLLSEEDGPERFRKWSALLGAIPTLDHLALLYIVASLARQGTEVSAPPEWASIPLVHLGIVYQDQLRWRDDFRAITTGANESDEAFAKLEELLRDALVRQADDEGIPLFEGNATPVQLSPSLRQRLSDFSQLASTILQEVLGPNAPTLDVRVSADDAIRAGTPVHIIADDYTVYQSLDVRSLSDAQRRWAVIAMRLAFAELFTRSPDASFASPLFLLLDEPDASLHLLARRSLADGLAALTERLQVPVVVSTHSVELIDHPSVRLWHTRRGENRTDVTRTTPGALTDLDAEALGLARSDMLLLTRAWLVVEGEHDRVVLQAWLGDELRDHRVRMLVMRGTKRSLSVLDSQILFDGTDAGVAVLLDNTRAVLTEKLNGYLRRLMDTPDERAATISRLADLLRDQPEGSEAWAVVDLVLAAARRGLAHRLVVVGLSKPDIIEYLPAGEFVAGASWPELVEEWRTWRRTNGSSIDFKGWLRNTKGARISAARLGELASEMDSIPAEVIELIGRLEDASMLRRP